MRGDIYELRANANAKGHEQQGRRYAVVLQSDVLVMSTTVTAPTSTSAREASHRPEIKLNGLKTKVLVEQMQAVDPEARFGRKVGRVSFDELQDIGRAMKLVLGLF
ncbi:MAG TPA: type II toxin-antitoxin system PemK/MazF family toxin [Pseudonocardiaceae bacterium]|jgi:mRNA interferase MazF|nr:type II toxin-antitoxin system PemK/MazF family toxin [Pseudonocardiaceae bacterium]